MAIALLDWQALTLRHDFSNPTKNVHFFDFQPQAKQAFDQFMQAPSGALLVVKSELFPEFLSEIEAYLAQSGVPIVSRIDFNKAALFGYHVFLEREHKTESVKGALQAADNGILMLNINALLSDISQWDKLKQALLFGGYEPHCVNYPPYGLAKEKVAFKLILIGEREDIAALTAYDDGLYQIGQYTEIKSYLTVKENLGEWAGYLQTMAEKTLRQRLPARVINQFLQAYIRESESRELISISPTLLKKHLSAIRSFYTDCEEITDVQTYFDYLEKQSAVFNEYTTQDILSNQLYIETQDEEIGQINGLSVIDFDGIPHSFGEPLRISCNVQYGDGEITDIERKVELGGNIHSKGIILAQSCLANLLELPTQLPFSASIAFEQSYGEIDGDSSSLAIFNVLVSALSNLPLPQSVAVTGAIDQFGNVLSVGGVNQKIEGFFTICNARTLTGSQGVIIPSACVGHLSLRTDVVEAVKRQQFHIWTVDDVFDAAAVLFKLPFFAEEKKGDNEGEALFSLIHRQLEQHQNSDTSGRFLQKFCKRLKIY